MTPDGRVIERLDTNYTPRPLPSGNFEPFDPYNVFCTIHPGKELYKINREQALFCEHGHWVCRGCGVILNDGRVFCSQHAHIAITELNVERRRSWWRVLFDLVFRPLQDTPVVQNPSLSRQAIHANTQAMPRPSHPQQAFQRRRPQYRNQRREYNEWKPNQHYGNNHRTRKKRG